MKVIYDKPHALLDEPFSFCPGCSHGTIQKLIARVIDKLGIEGDAISVASVGCSGTNPYYMNMDTVYSMHGRAPAVATGIKRIHPEKIVFTSQGDGDLASIGTAEIVHACNRGENISVFFINNANYGMTGGQMAPTSVLGQKTSTTPYGRESVLAGFPIKTCEMLSQLDGAAYIERVIIDTPSNIRKAEKAVERAFVCQIEKKGFALVEFLAICPTNLRLSPLNSIKWMQENMLPSFPVGNFKNFK